MTYPELSKNPNSNPAIEFRDNPYCTLNGKPAKISGWLCKFAEVHTLDNTIKATWCWETVANIMKRDKCFIS
jgi:hypothetical protein